MKNNETGRSMVEIFAVLAIAGIISIGGVKGFQLAMSKHRANGIAELIGELSLQGQAQNRCITLEDEEDYSEELDDFTKPNCVSRITAGRTGQVKIIFEEEESCEGVEKYVKGAFGECRLDTTDAEDHTYIFVPTRGNACKTQTCENGVCRCTQYESGSNANSPCSQYTKDPCLR